MSEPLDTDLVEPPDAWALLEDRLRRTEAELRKYHALAEAARHALRLPHSSRCTWQEGNDDCDCDKAELTRALAALEAEAPE